MGKKTKDEDYMSEAMDNFDVKVTAHTTRALELAVELVALRHGSVTGWSERDEWIVLFWSKPAGTNPNYHPFPRPLDSYDTAHMIAKWLEDKEPIDKHPDIDGSVSKGFQLKTQSLGWHYESLAVRAVWALHGK